MNQIQAFGESQLKKLLRENFNKKTQTMDKKSIACKSLKEKFKQYLKSLEKSLF